MFKTKRLTLPSGDINNALESWANTIDSAIEVRPIDEFENPLDIGTTIYIGAQLSEVGYKLVLLRKNGETLDKIGTIDVTP
jgi:hypothetical protein